MLFEQMPTSFLFERTLFVHGGIPRDDTFAERYRDLVEPQRSDMRFQMMWSDPVADRRRAGRAAAQEPALHVRPRPVRSVHAAHRAAHDDPRPRARSIDGFEVIYDLGERMLLNLFSAGGADNDDLPERRVVPHGDADGAHDPGRARASSPRRRGRSSTSRSTTSRTTASTVAAGARVPLCVARRSRCCWSRAATPAPRRRRPSTTRSRSRPARRHSRPSPTRSRGSTR